VAAFRLPFKKRRPPRKKPHLYFKAGKWRWEIPDLRDRMVMRVHAIYLKAWIDDRVT